MATVEARTTKTLADGVGSLFSEPAMSQTPMAGSGSGPDENGIRVPADNKEGSNEDTGRGGGVVVVTRRVVETEVSVEKTFGDQNRVESFKESDSSLDVEKIEEEHGIGKNAAKSNSTVSVGDGSDRMVEYNGNGISLVVEVHGSLASVNERKKKCGYEEDKGNLAENGGNPGGKFTERPGSVSKVGEKGDIIEKGGNQELNGNGEEDEDGKDVGEDNGEEDDDGRSVGDQEHEYTMGDFVWGKIRSHPWWPGQIYDPSDASDYAVKYSQRDRLLVAYFGDGSFSWCFPSQLKPFAENFEEMSEQSNSKSFVNAVHKALDQIGRLLELEMTCSCIPEEIQIGLSRPLVVNAGIKAGVVVPEGGTSKLSLSQHQPAELLANVRSIARVVSVSNMLELTVLKSWLSAFYCAKGGYSLPMYHEPQDIEGLEDKNKNGGVGATDFNGPVEVPIQGSSEEDWHSLPVSPGFRRTSQSLQKCTALSKDKLYQRRKQKSVAELMGEDMDVEPKNKESIVKEGTHTSKSTSGKKKRNGNDEADSVLTWARKRGRKKKADICESPNGSRGEDKANKNSVSRELKRNKVSSVENDDVEAKQETEISASRERKKSRYLSPPYTNLKWRVRNSSSKSVSEAESEKIAKNARMGERMTRAAGHLIGSPPILECSGETFQKKHSESGPDISGSSRPQTAKQEQKKIIDFIDTNASTKEVLSLVHSVALNPLYLRGKKSFDMVTGFISTFRSSIYLNGSNYKMYHKRRPGRKRKSLISEIGVLEKNLTLTVQNSPEPRSQQTWHKKSERSKLDKPKLKRAARASETFQNSPEPRSRQTGHEKSERSKLDKPKLKRAARASGMKTNDEDDDREASPVSLIVTFPRGFHLPSKDHLIKIFSKFGALNEMETDVFTNSYCARVVFVRNSDAEEAFSISAKKSPFGAANVNYRLWYSSAASKANETDQKASSPLEKTPENPVASQPAADDNEVSRLCFIRQKLEMITSMLENSDGKISPETKSNLEGEMKGLLEKVSTMAGSTSS